MTLKTILLQDGIPGVLMAKLWQKDYELDQLIESFTVGRDYLLDQEMLPADVIASMAQAVQLRAMGILSANEESGLQNELRSIVIQWRSGQLTVRREDEDCHTTIENRLTEKVGEAGKKIHTGRSRNDQVLTALRVFARFRIHGIRVAATELIEALLDFAEKNSKVPMPGRTHLQTGMPSSVGLWACAWAEELLDDLRLVDTAYSLINQSPLGAAASYGVPLPLDRDLTGRLLGFAKVQRNVLYANNSRGKFESVVLEALDQIGLTLSKAAQDLILFSLPEFGYFRLPSALCSGSSIMPQKKNPDALELMRAKSGTLSSYAIQVKNIIRSLPSGYNRDFQETKEPFFRGLSLAADCLGIMTLTFRELETVPEALKKGFTPDIFATDAAYERVLSGQSFRDAYREVGLSLETLAGRDPVGTIENRTYLGTAGNLGISESRAELSSLRTRHEADRRAVVDALRSLAGAEAWEACGL